MTAIINLLLSRSKRDKHSDSRRPLMLYRIARWKRIAARAECWHLMNRTKILKVFRFPDDGGMPKRIQPNWPRNSLSSQIGTLPTWWAEWLLSLEILSFTLPGLSCGGFELSSFLGKHHRQGCKNFQSPTQPLAQHTPRSDTLQGILCCH